MHHLWLLGATMANTSVSGRTRLSLASMGKTWRKERGRYPALSKTEPNAEAIIKANQGPDHYLLRTGGDSALKTLRSTKKH